MDGWIARWSRVINLTSTQVIYPDPLHQRLKRKSIDLARPQTCLSTNPRFKHTLEIFHPIIKIKKFFLKILLKYELQRYVSLWCMRKQFFVKETEAIPFDGNTDHLISYRPRLEIIKILKGWQKRCVNVFLNPRHKKIKNKKCCRKSKEKNGSTLFTTYLFSLNILRSILTLRFP